MNKNAKRMSTLLSFILVLIMVLSFASSSFAATPSAITTTTVSTAPAVTKTTVPALTKTTAPAVTNATAPAVSKSTASALTKTTAPAVTKAVSTLPAVATIVSPVNNSVSVSDSLLVSVKLTNPGTAKITVYEQKEMHTQILATGTALDGTYATYAAVSYSSFDTTSFAATDFASNPALDSLVSRVYINPVSYTSTENIGFYTKQLTDVKPGIYKIEVKVLGEDGETISTVSSLVAVKEKPAEEKPAQVFEQKPSGALKILQNLLKSLFK